MNYIDKVLYTDPDGNRSIHVDFSTLSDFAICEEKGRLSKVEMLEPIKENLALSFGHVFHTGTAAWDVTRDTTKVIEAIAEDLKKIESSMPLVADDEKRTIERLTNLVLAYCEKWSDEPFEVAWRDDGKPLVEIGFSLHARDWNGIPIMLSGRIDAIKKSKTDGQFYVFDRKTSGSSVSAILNAIRPNHQLSGYVYAARTLLGLEVAGAAHDAVYISDRQPNEKKGGWMRYGIDIEKDFGRAFTLRSNTDIEEYLYDFDLILDRFLTRVGGDLRRWHRNAPVACTMYGGCKFKEVCSTNLNKNIIETNFVRKPWHPWATEEAGKR